jgi:hypothetical protein
LFPTLAKQFWIGVVCLWTVLGQEDEVFLEPLRLTEHMTSKKLVQIIQAR